MQIPVLVLLVWLEVLAEQARRSCGRRPKAEWNDVFDANELLLPTWQRRVDQHLRMRDVHAVVVDLAIEVVPAHAAECRVGDAGGRCRWIASRLGHGELVKRVGRVPERRQIAPDTRVEPGRQIGHRIGRASKRRRW